MALNRKRILFIITQSEMGGAQRFVYELSSKLDKQKYDILVASGPDGDGELPAKLGETGTPYLRLNHLRRKIDIREDLRAVSEIKNLAGEFKPDTVFLNSSKAGFIGSLALRLMRSKLPKTKVIYRIGGWTFNDPWPTWKKKLWINLERQSAPWKDIIIVNNEHDYNQAIDLKIRPRRNLVLVHNGLDIYKMKFLPREEARLKLFEKLSRQSGKIFQTETIIGTIANMYPTKGLTSLIEAAEYFKNNSKVSFFIIGSGSEYNNLKFKIENLKLQHKVYLLGNIPDAKEYLQAFDVFVLPSLKEGFPWSLIEAMAARLPVIATKVGAVPEIIENGENGFMVEPGKPEQIAKKITEILSSDYLKKEFAIKAHQTVLFKFTEDKMVKEIEILL